MKIGRPFSYMIIVISLASLNIRAESKGLEAVNLGHWRFDQTPPNIEISQLKGTEGILTYGQSKAGPLITVTVQPVPIRSRVSLGENVEEWHKFIFANPQTVAMSEVK